MNESLDIGVLIRIWNDGNLQLGKIKECHRHPQLVHYNIIRTIYRGSDYNQFIHEEISSVNNIVKNYGKVSFEEHQDLFPEDWI